jgi:hypothetical protein
MLEHCNSQERPLIPFLIFLCKLSRGFPQKNAENKFIQKQNVAGCAFHITGF